MRSFRFLHTADLHLGTPFHGLQTRVSESVMAKMRAASYNAFAQIVDIAVSENVDFVLIAGDLFDADVVAMAALFELRRGFERLAAAGIRVYVCHGNHDPLSSPRGMEWPDNVTVFPAAPKLLTDAYRVPSAYFDLDADTRIQLSGYSYGQPVMTQSPAGHYVRDPKAAYAIALFHGVVGSPGKHENYCATTVAELLQSDFDYWALGHIHQAEVLRAHRPTIVYPGNPQGRHIHEDGPRCCVIVDVGADGNTDFKQVPTSTVIWTSCDVEITGVEELSAVRSRVHDAVRAIVEANGNAYGLVRLVFKGSTPLHAKLMEANELLEVLNEDIQYLRLPLWIERLVIETKPSVDMAALSHSAEYVGEFLRLVQRYQNDVALAREALLPALRDVYHRANDLSLEELTDDEVRDLLQLAELLALQFLGEQGEAS